MATNNRKTLIIGTSAAVAAGLVSILAAFWPKTAKKSLKYQATEVANNVLDNLQWVPNNKKLVASSVAGSILGIATALLLAPKAGKDLLNDLAGYFKSEIKPEIKKASKVIRHVAAAKSVQKRKAPVAKVKAKKVTIKKVHK